MGNFQTNPFADQIALERAKQSLYGQYGNPAQTTPSPITPGNPTIGAPSVEQKPEQTQVKTQAPPMIPVQESKIGDHIPSALENQAVQLQEQQKLQPQYQRPHGIRKFLGNALKIGGDLVTAATGSPGIAQLANQGGEAILNGPYNEKMKEFNSQLAPQVAQYNTAKDAATAQANLEHTQAQAEAQKAYRIEQETKGKTAQQMADFKTNQANFQAKLSNDLAKVGARHNDAVQYQTPSGAKGTAFVNLSDPNNPTLTDIVTHQSVEPGATIIPIGKTPESRIGSGSEASQIALDRTLNTDASNAHANQVLQAKGDLLGATGVTPELRKQQVESQINANQAGIPLRQAQTANAQNQRGDRSYQFNATEINKLGTPIEDSRQRLSKLETTLSQRNPAGDSSVAAQLLQVLEGGQGSGLRMNQAAINSIAGGQVESEKLKQELHKWALDPNTAQIPEARRAQITKIIGVLRKQADERSQAINEAHEKLLDSNNPAEHRAIVNEATRKLSQTNDTNTVNYKGNEYPRHFERTINGKLEKLIFNENTGKYRVEGQ